MMIKIAVIGGGLSAEREISLRSAENIFEGLKKAGYEADLLDLDIEPDKEYIAALQNYDLVMPILHGQGGEDGTIQKLLSEAKIKYLGSDAESSRLAFNKILTKDILIANNIDVPAGVIVSKDNIDEFIKGHNKYVIKPIGEGSSIDTIINRGIASSQEKIEGLFNKYDEMLAEEMIEGVEISVSVLGSKVLPPVAIFPPENEEFDLNNKYNGKTTEMCPIPESILPMNIVVESQKLAERIHHSIGARHLSRTDMIVSAEGRITVLEINTMPGLTKQSLLIRSAQEAGLSTDLLATELVRIALGM